MKFLWILVFLLGVQKVKASDEFEEKDCKVMTPEVFQQSPEAFDIYKTCSSQKEKYEKVLERSKSENKNMIIVLGYNSCPWCHSLHKLFSDGSFKSSLNKDVNYVELSIFFYTKEGEDKKDEETYSIVKSILGLESDEELKAIMTGFPFVIVYNPKLEKYVGVSTGMLEKNTETVRGHDSDKVRKVLNEAIESVSFKEDGDDQKKVVVQKVEAFFEQLFKKFEDLIKINDLYSFEER